MEAIASKAARHDCLYCRTCDGHVTCTMCAVCGVGCAYTHVC